MLQRGRKTALRPFNIGKPPRLKPPAFLNDEERAVFDELIDTVDRRHFIESDLPLIVSYIQAILISRSSARDPDKVATWEKAVRVQTSLATRLRLAPSARTDPKTLARQQRQQYHGPRPWEL
jgi:hypothetical protein